MSGRFFLLVLFVFLVACGVTSEAPVADDTVDVGQFDGGDVDVERFPAEKYADLEIVTLLPRDGIPAIDDPQFIDVAEADDVYDAEELVIGVEFNGEARAYSVPLLSNHEIVNDTVGGVKIAVTW